MSNDNNGGLLEKAGDIVANNYDRTAEFDPQDIQQNKVISGLAYLGILFFLPLIACPNSKFGRFHSNQALVLFIVEVIAGTAFKILAFIPILGALASLVIFLAIFGIFIFGIVNAFNGKAKELPLIGSIKIIY